MKIRGEIPVRLFPNFGFDGESNAVEREECRLEGLEREQRQKNTEDTPLRGVNHFRWRN